MSSILIGIVDIKHNAFSGLARAQECVSADRATVCTKDVTNVDDLPESETGEQSNAKYRNTFLNGDEIDLLLLQRYTIIPDRNECYRIFLYIFQ